MPSTFSRDTRSALIDRTLSDINSGITGADARLRRSVLNVLANVQAKIADGLYSGIEYAIQQSQPTLAQLQYLEGWGATYGIPRNPAAKAEGNVTFTGANGAVVDIGTVLRRSDGIEFETITGGLISGGTLTLAVRATETGENGNTAASSSLSIVAAIAGVSPTATVATGGLAGGADIEDYETYRDRILFRIQRPPHGGNKDDYVRWVQEVYPSARVFPSPLEMGPGTVTVRFVLDDVYSNGIPQGADVTAVQNWINQPDKRPVTALVTVAAPTPVNLNITIASLSPDTPAIRAAVQAELQDMIFRDREPGGTIRISRIWEAVSIATGERSHRITSPTNDVTYSAGQIPVLGTVTFT